MSEESDVAYADAVKVSRKRHIVDEEEDPEECGQAILKRLNEDCWRAVLDYVHIKDLLTLEQLSPGWKDLVHNYLQGAGMCLVSIHDIFEHQDARMLKLQNKNRINIMKFNGYHAKEYSEAISFIEKWGPSIVYTYCPARRGALMKIARNCPNLKSISIEMYGFGTGDLSPELVEFTEKLERIAFMDYANMDNLDDTMDMCNEDVRKSAFAYRDDQFASSFWRNFKPTNLKSIIFRGGFDFRYFLSAVECYPNVTELALQGGNINIHLLSEKIPKLERICIMGGSHNWIDSVRESMCSELPCLKHFIVWESSINNCLPEVILTKRRGLQSLDIRCVGNILFLDKLLQAHGPTLTDVRLVDSYFTDEHMVTLVKSCPNLMSLDLRLCRELTDSILAKIASVVKGRPSPLRVHLGGLEKNTCDKIVKAKFPELIFEVEPFQNAYTYYESMRPRQYIWGVEDHRDFRDRWMKFI